jgi:DNA (cytosine-5)-methyltransferase 1
LKVNLQTEDPQPLVVEGFAGPGGWSTGLAMLLAALGFKPRSLAVEWDSAACKTAVAAGHPRVRADVARFHLDHLRGLVWLLILSPPCQAWSRSGKRKGILDQPAIFAHAMRVIAAGEWIDYADAGPLRAGEGDGGGTWHDARSPLVLEVIRWVMAVQPVNICLEQVPDVLPFWELIARWLRTQGYNVWAGCLSSERYGVPQTRERAIVIASRERAVSAPAATHTAYDARLADGGKWHGTDGDLFGAGLEPWVSMAEAIGWGWTAGPAWTVMTARGRQTGHDVMRGSSWRAGKIAELTHGPDWLLHTNRDQRPDGTRQVIDPAARPAPTLTAKSGGQWQMRPAAMGDVRMANGTVRDVDHPAGTITASLDNGNHRWVHERPATTVQGDPRIAQPGHRDREGGERQFEGASVRVTVQEAAVLQSFPPDYPWQGTKSAAFRQVGDAVPPRLAAAVIGTCLGLDWQAAVAAHYAGEVAA